MPYDPSLHLFCHPWELQTVVHMRRTWNRPARVQMAPVLAPTEPWEGTSVVTWGTAHYDPETGLFKLWYEAWNAERPQPLVSLVCYATSTDGVTWDKPDLGFSNGRAAARTTSVG